MLIDRCQFLTSEDALDVVDRKTIAVNTNANDIKLRNNRATKFRHFAVLGGRNSVVMGNHFFQGDSVPAGIRTAGLVLVNDHTSTLVNSNYIDNCFIEWTNERDATPNFSAGYSFSALSVGDNVFLSGGVAPWFSYIVVKPYGTGHFLNGVSVTGNKFRSLNGPIDRVDRVDTSFADLDFARFKNVLFHGNSYHAISKQVTNPLRIKHTQSSNSTTWTIDADGELPFGGRMRNVDSVVATDKIRNSSSVVKYTMPYAVAEQGPNKDQVSLVWESAMRGEVTVVVRIDA